MADPIEFDWDEANIDHIALHQVAPAEAEQVIASRPVLLREEIRDNELRRSELGQTDEDRILVVVTIKRPTKVRVVTAHPADQKLRRYWISLQPRRQP